MASKELTPLEEERHFVCGRYPQYGIGDYVKFENGQFTAKTQEALDLILSNDWFGVYMFEQQKVNAGELIELLEDEGYSVTKTGPKRRRRSPRAVVGAILEPEEADAVRMAAMAESEPVVRQGMRGTK